MNLKKILILIFPIIFIILAGIHLYLDPLGFKPVTLFCKQELQTEGELFEFNREKFEYNLQGNRFDKSQPVISFNRSKAVYGNSDKLDSKAPNYIEVTIDRITGKLSIFENGNLGVQFFKFYECNQMHEAKPKF